MITEMEKWRENYFNDIGKKYRNHVNKFIDYLKKIDKSDTPNNITIQDVTGSVGYYVKLGSIQSISSMELHLESLKNFYDYLLNIGKSNDIFSQMNYEEYKRSLADKFQLAEKVTRGTFSIETMKDILSKLDNELGKDYNTLKGKQVQKKYIHTMALNLFIKLTLVAPAKRRVIGNIKYSSFDEELRKLSINSIEISIPNSLRRDLINAINLRYRLSNEEIKPDDNIFKYIVKSTFTEENVNQWFCSFIKRNNIVEIDDINNKSKTYAIEPIMKTAISNLVKESTNLAYISKISGIKISSLEETYYKELFEMTHRQPSIGEAIDWEIRKSGYYSYI
ncbi:MAG: hypothetical protein ACRCVJ_01145 [Clostridium sp.]|uniref:hypothetical protein n=1 Tax=Clostridium sp. TaxID=1506 RepID=UPI003F3EFCB8